MRNRLRALLDSALGRCFDQGELTPAPLTPYVIEIPANPAHGEFATNLPMTLAGSQKRPPREIAGILLRQLNQDAGLLDSAEVAGPGFINFRIRPAEWRRLLIRIAETGPDYGRSSLGAGRKVMIEFVSANPTGPLHLGHGRGAALGDTLCRMFAHCGYDVRREFYINDAGLQVHLLGQSIFARWKQRTDPGFPFPEKGYHGDYVVELARTLAEAGGLESLDPEEAAEYCARRGKEVLLREIQADLARFRVHFDEWFSESRVFESGLLEETLHSIADRGHLYEQDGALWIRTTAFGDDKDRVLRKKDGQFTYFASDIAYHLDKRRRGMEKAINIWGADHHGYVPRMKAALVAQGFPEDWLQIILLQFVKLWQGGQEVRMSKRAGSFVTLQELMDEVGVDAVRYVFLTKSPDSALDVNLDLIKRQDSENPVYYVQYAHARLCSIFRKAEEEGLAPPVRPAEAVEHLILEEELALIRIMAEFPLLLEEATRSLEPHRLTYYLGELAGAFHRYFNLGTKLPQHRILGQDQAKSQARLLLAGALRSVLAVGLDLLGVAAPETM